MSYPPYQGYGQQQPPYGQQQYPPPGPGGQYYQQPPPPHGQYPPPHQGQYPPPAQHPPPQQGYYQQPPPQHGQYPPAPQGYPPQGQYAPPPQQGQYPPPSQQYGAPPPGQYGAPPPGQYGAPPPSQYGAPPPGQYGAPPPQQYGAPPPGPPVPPTPPSLGYGPPQIIQWDATADAKACRAAMKGFGTDEKALIRVVTKLDPLQIETLKQTYHRLFSRDLVKDVESETSGDLEGGLLAVLRGPLHGDVWDLYRAMAGAGTDEDALNDVLLSRSNADLQAVKGMYNHTFRRRLEDDVKGDLSGKTERHFMMVLGANRAEDAAPVNPQQVDLDVQDIYKATEGRMGTDELLVCSILSARNDSQIRAIAQMYKQRYSKDLEGVIKSEFSGHMRDALLFQLRNALDKYIHAAKLLEATMAGAGTREKLLTRRIVRFHWDQATMRQVRAAYQRVYGKDLARRVKGETGGDYERFLLACMGEPI